MPRDRQVPLFEVLRGSVDGSLPEVIARGVPGLAVQCARHGVSAYVANALDRHGLTLGPEQAALSRDAMATIGAGLKLRRLLFTVLDALAARALSPILLKGYGLAARLYPDPLSRPSTDVDLLVAREEIPVVREVLEGLGLSYLADASLHDVFEEHHHLAFAGRSGLVEVHFRLFYSFGGVVFDEQALRDRALSATLDGRAVRYLGPEDEFVYLATHAANHAFLRASWLVDLQLYLTRAPELRWDLASRVARSARCVEPMAAALGILESVLGVDLPPAARRAFAPGWWHARLDQRLFSARRLVAATQAQARLSNFLIRFWLVDSPSQGVRHVFDGALRLVRRARARGRP